MGHWHFLNSTGDKGNIKRQRHATLAFRKIDMRHGDPHQGPHSGAHLIGRRGKGGRTWDEAFRLVVDAHVRLSEGREWGVGMGGGELIGLGRREGVADW